MRERALHELLDRMRDPGRDHVVARLVLLQHQPHRAHVVGRVAPVAARGEVAEPQLALAGRARSPPRRGRPCAAGSRAAAAATRGCRGSRERGVEAVAAPVAARDEVPVRLRDAVRRQRRERRQLVLRRLDAARRRSRSTTPGRSGSPRRRARIDSSSVVTPTAANSAVSDRLLPRGGHERDRARGCRPRAGRQDSSARTSESWSSRSAWSELDALADRLEVLVRRPGGGRRRTPRSPARAGARRAASRPGRRSR